MSVDKSSTQINKKKVEKTYSGVLGKIIGVYLGRAVEGWELSLIHI